MAEGALDLAHSSRVGCRERKRVLKPCGLRQGTSPTPALLDKGGHEGDRERVARPHGVHGAALGRDARDEHAVAREQRRQAAPRHEHGAPKAPSREEVGDGAPTGPAHRELGQVNVGRHLGEVLGRAVLVLLAKVIGQNARTTREQRQPGVNLRVAAGEDRVEAAGVLDVGGGRLRTGRPGLSQLDALEAPLAGDAVLVADLGRAAGDDLAGAHVHPLGAKRAEQPLAPGVVGHAAEVARLMPEPGRTHGDVHRVATGIGDAEVVVGVEDVVSQAKDPHQYSNLR